LGLALVAGPFGCQRMAPSLQVGAAAAATGSVKFTINIPKKVSKAVRRVQATGNESSTLMVNQVQVYLSGPGFFSPLYPENAQATQGEMAVQSGSISSQFLTVPTGKNRFIKVIAKNGDQKLNQVAGVLDVQPGPFNHVLVGLSTTPTATVIEKLAAKAPESARGFNAQTLQYWLDTQVTKPKTEPQNTFDGVHPYLVNADGIVDYLIANNFTVPADFDITRTADKAFVYNAGSVHITLDQALPAGSRVWLNDPTSAILDIAAYDPAVTTYDIPNVAPNFEQLPDDVVPPAWTLTIMTPDGRLTSVPVAIARQPLSQGTLPAVNVDLSNSLKTIKRIFLSPGDATWTGTSFALNGRKVQQLFVYAVYDDAGTEKVVPLLPSALDWQSLDAARLKVGNGGQLDGTKLNPDLIAADPNLAGASLEDYGLVYPLAETDATTPKATIRGTMKGNPALTATVDFTVGYLGSDTGRVKVDMAADGIYVAKPDGIYVAQLTQTITDSYTPVTLTVVENGAPAGTTYAWKCDQPQITFGKPSGTTVAVSAIAPLQVSPATVTVYSSTGRTATAKVTTSFNTSANKADATIVVPADNLSFSPLNTTNVGNPAFTVNTGYANGGYLNAFAGQATLQAADSTDPANKFFFKSSDPFTVSVSGTFPSTSCTLTGLRPNGTVTIYATDQNGRTINTTVRTNFDQVGKADVTVTAPVNGIDLAPGTTVSTIATDLNALATTKTYTGVEAGVASPLFTWVSLDPTRLAITPPAGQSFPNAQATFKALRTGSASFQLISAQTGERQTFTVNLNFTVIGKADAAVTVPSLVVTQTTPTPVFNTSNGSVIKTLGQLVTLQASDPTDVGATFVWTTDDENRATLMSQTGLTAQYKLLDYGPVTVRVVNTRNGRWGWMTFDVQKTGAGTGTINVTL
jgi:hypothetical protein